MSISIWDKASSNDGFLSISCFSSPFSSGGFDDSTLDRVSSNSRKESRVIFDRVFFIALVFNWFCFLWDNSNLNLNCSLCRRFSCVILGACCFFNDRGDA